MPAWPPGASRSITIVRRRSDALCTAAASPAGPRTDDHRVVLRGVRLGVELEQLGDPAQLRPHDGLAVDDADHRAVSLGRQRAAPLLDRIVRVRLEPGERDLVAVEEAPQVGARSVPAIADDDRPRRRWLRGDARQPARAAHPVACERPDGLDEPRLLGGDRVVVVRLDAHHARRLRCTESDREHGAERDRHLAEEVAGVALADDARDAVDELDRLDAALEQGEERAPSPSCAAYSPGARLMSADVRASRSRLSGLRAAKYGTRSTSSGVTIGTRR